MKKLFPFSFNLILKSFLTILFTLILLSSCDMPKKPAVGLEDEIFVIADSTEYLELEPVLLQVFNKKIITPQPEALFELTRKSINSLSKLQNKKNIIIIAPFNSGSRVSNYIKSLLDSNVTQLVKSDSNYVFIKKDLWAGEQLVMILTSPTIQQLKHNILEGRDDLIYYFQNISNQRLKRNLYSDRFENFKLEGELLRDYGWVIYVQVDFHLAKNDPENNFVWLRRAPGSDIERWVFIHWIDNASPEYLNPDSIAAVRNRITKKYLRSSDDKANVEISDEFKMTKEVNFIGRYALMTQGLWRMSDKTMGGPFVNYTFFDEKTNRIYMLDGSVYAPKYYKKKLIQQVDVLLQSFLFKDDLSESRIDELLDAAE